MIRDTSIRWHRGNAVPISVALIVTFALTSCISERHHAGRSPAIADTAQPKATVSEIPLLRRVDSEPGHRAGRVGEIPMSFIGIAIAAPCGRRRLYDDARL